MATATTPRAEAHEAVLHRMVMEDHVCPYGLKSKWLLEREGFEVVDLPLRTREETDAFQRRHDVETTPQAFIDGERIGGYDALRRYFDRPALEQGETTYQPVLAVFGVAAALGLAISIAAYGTVLTVRAAEWFVALSMAMLAMLKLQDIRSFSTRFLNYDLLARRWVPYGFVYPFAELTAAVLMVAGAWTFLSAPLALFVGTVGAVSVIKAVWVDGRELKCACVGGGSNVPLGFISLTENVAMVAMGIWMPLRHLVV